MMLNRKMMLLSVLLAALAFSGAALNAHAADIFNKHPSSNTPKADPLNPKTQSQDNGEVLDLLDEAPAPSKSEEEPETIEDFANRYYRNCMQQDHPYLEKDDLTLLCGCTSAEIPKSMTVKQMKDMQTGGEEGQLQRARMMMFVYTPCIRYPTRALVLDQCANNPQVRSTMKNYMRVCGCLADSMGDYMDKNAPKAMQTALTRNITDLDPLGSLMQSKGFEEYSQYYMRECIRKHELGQ